MNSKSDTNATTMSESTLKQELAKRGLQTHGLKPVLVARLKQELSMNSNQAFRSCTKQLKDAAVRIAAAEKKVAAARRRRNFCFRTEERAFLEAMLASSQQELDVLKREYSEVQHRLDKLEPRLFFAPKLPACVLLSILGQLGMRICERSACVKRE